MEYFGAHKLAPSVTTPWIIALSVVGIIVIALNILTLLTFYKSPSFRSRQHVLIVNLAVADFLFGVAGIPSVFAFLLKPTIHSYYVFQSLNTFSKLAAFFTLGAIAVERMHAIVWPIRHHVLSNSIYKTVLILIWVLSAVVTTFAVLNLTGYWVVKASLFKALLPVVIFGIVITIFACYISIWVSVRRRKRRKLGPPANRDKALAAALLLVAGTFVVTWVIPMFFLSISRMCKTCFHPTASVVGCILLIIALQSLVNPVIYCFRLPGFKDSLKVRGQKITFIDNIRPLRKRKTTATSAGMTRVSDNKGTESVTAF